MAGSVNKVILIGNLGADPEVKHLEGGSVVARFNIATSEVYTNKNKERVEQTEWHRIEMWDRLAEIAEKYLKKGNQVFIEGRLRTENWTDKEGAPRSGVTIRANGLTLLGSRDSAAGANEASKSTPPKPDRETSPISPSLSSDDDDLPF